MAKSTSKSKVTDTVVTESEKNETVAAAPETKVEKKPAAKKAKDSKPAKTEKAEKTAEVKTDAAEVAAPEASAEKAEKADKKPASTSKAPAKKMTMAELLAKSENLFRTPRKGETVTGTVADKTRKALLIDIGGKTEGIVADKEFDAAKEYIETLEIGSKIEAYVISTENDRGQILLSLKKAAMDTKWDEFTDAMKESKTVEVRGLEVNKGGLIVTVEGIRGFIPTSQFGKENAANIMKLKNKKISVKVIEVDREKNRLIFSEKHVSEAGEMAQRAQALTSVKVGEIYSGSISGVMHFGLFVTVHVPLAEGSGSVEGLVHISEISWEKVADPHDFHKVGDDVKVKVLGIDEENGKLNLSIKQLQADPWQNIAERYPVGTTIAGKVSRTAPFGVFVKLEPGVDGLIHTSKLAPDQTYESGDDVTVVVESVDAEQRRMSLSVILTEVPVGYK